MNFNLHFGELHTHNSIKDKKNLFENYNPKCYKVKRILIYFNCFSEYITVEKVDAFLELKIFKNNCSTMLRKHFQPIKQCHMTI